MEFKNLIFEITEKGVGIMTINRPKALNALNSETVTEMKQCVEAVATMPEVKVLVITGSGQKSFVAGADIVEMSTKKSDRRSCIW
jgi:enoyl-CoA hydratase